MEKSDECRYRDTKCFFSFQFVVRYFPPSLFVKMYHLFIHLPIFIIDIYYFLVSSFFKVLHKMCQSFSEYFSSQLFVIDYFIHVLNHPEVTPT